MKAISYSAEIKLSRAQYCFLRDYFKRKNGIAAKRLIRMAIAEIVTKQASAELAKLYTEIDDKLNVMQ